ncbi:MAG: glycosyltransferase [Clostridium sp.]|nr:glycosyltransferase [Clostridium sp.]MDU7084663.1 glycosyltransferase [Clostridium sp.]
MKVLVTAIVPVYNSQRYLNKCIESLRGQTLKDIELIFINDGSTDESLNILRKYEKLDSRIKVIDQINSGPSIARNVGIEIAEGEYISFIDSDDWIDEKMYEEMYLAASKDKMDVVICDMITVYKECKSYVKGIDSKLQDYKRCDIENVILKALLSSSQFNSMANKIFKTSVIKGNRMKLDENIYYAEDWLFNMEFLKKATSAKYIEKAFYYYRRGHESSSSRYLDDTFEKAGLWVYRKRKEYAKELGLNQFLGSKDFYDVIIHCIVSEFRREDIKLSRKFKRISKIINLVEVKEVIENIHFDKYSFKKKLLYNSIRFEKVGNLYLYVLAGKLKEAMLGINWS